jgi:hypothetical protein
MTTQNTQALLLRNQQGDFFIISEEAVQAGRVPADKMQAVQQALSGGSSGEVSGYLFDNTFQNAFTGLSQNNTNIGNNFVLGGVVGLNNQSLSQLGVNVGTVNATQAKL